MGIHPLKDHPAMVFVHEWKAIGESLFGPNKREWKFVCPTCNEVSTVQEAVDSFGDITNPKIGQKCPKCLAICRPPETYGPETCYRVLFMPEDAPGYDVEPQGQLCYVMPFWAPDRVRPNPPKFAALVAIENLTTEEAPTKPIVASAPAQKPPTKKGGKSYGFQF